VPGKSQKGRLPRPQLECDGIFVTDRRTEQQREKDLDVVKNASTVVFIITSGTDSCPAMKRITSTGNPSVTT
jgi:hypothetical protein